MDTAGAEKRKGKGVDVVKKDEEVAKDDEGEGEGEEEEEEDLVIEARQTRAAQQRAELVSKGAALRTRGAVEQHQRESHKRPASDAVPGGVKRVVVVGAGYAGISAARTLSDLGYSVRAAPASPRAARCLPSNIAART